MNDTANDTTQAVSRTNGEHYLWGADCDAWHLVKSSALSVIEERIPPHTDEVRHVHARSRQFFYVLSGELTIEVDHREHLLHPHEGLEIAPGQVHQVSNKADVDARLLVISSPPSHGDRTNL
ncbi:MAG TPA: cupin domain-containing protein [Granulicella sp.]